MAQGHLLRRAAVFACAEIKGLHRQIRRKQKKEF